MTYEEAMRPQPLASFVQGDRDIPAEVAQLRARRAAITDDTEAQAEQWLTDNGYADALSYMNTVVGPDDTDASDILGYSYPQTDPNNWQRRDDASPLRPYNGEPVYGKHPGCVETTSHWHTEVDGVRWIRAAGR